MTLKEAFNSTEYKYHKQAAHMLYVDAGPLDYRFDFAMRVMTVDSQSGISAVPFAQVDKDMLNAMRDKLVELGGTPPELADDTAALAKPRRSTPNP